MENIEQTLVLVKPDALQHAGEIIKIFVSNELQVEKLESMYLDDEIIAEHYGHVMDKPFFPRLSEFMMSGPVIAMILSGEDAVAKVRMIIGKTNSLEAAPGTIRNMYGTDSTMNAVHASDSVENAQIEIDRFFNRKTRSR